MCTALDVAKYIINYSAAINTAGKITYMINNHRLQKLLYFIQAQSYRKNGKPLFQDDIEAWSIGPVISSVYSYYPSYGQLRPEDNRDNSAAKTNETEQEIVRTVVNGLEAYSTDTLDDICFSQQPWVNAFEKGKINTIPKDNLKNYFRDEENDETR